MMNPAWAAEAGRAAESGGGYWQLALILAGIGFLGLFARWRKARMPVLPTSRELRDRDADADRHRDAADRALVELLETSRVLNAQVDAKIRVLNRLVKEAEDAAVRLEGMLSRARGAREEEFSAPAALPAAPEAAEPSGEESRRVFMSDLHERICRLRSEGRNSAEIAKATNLSTTEVEFIVKTLG